MTESENRIEMKLYEDSDKPDFEWVKAYVDEKRLRAICESTDPDIN